MERHTPQCSFSGAFPYLPFNRLNNSPVSIANFLELCKYKYGIALYKIDIAGRSALITRQHGVQLLLCPPVAVYDPAFPAKALLSENDYIILFMR